uniref:2-aminoethanethiol (cysteamine) dioxygenase a n=2 Tax=Erpetoichthys calabaricus TaxID=27687 RepID=A0A8C4RFP7_ERPCA
MPRENMASLIQKIARQARATFKNCGSSALGDGNKVFLENHVKLRNLLSEIRAEDLNITPRKVDSTPVSVPQSPPVTYMHICETDAFSMGVFLLKNGSSIPLHDHPGMHGMLKVIYGKVRITCFDKLEDGPATGGGVSGGGGVEVKFNPPLLPYQRDSVSSSFLRSAGEYTKDNTPCVLTPQRDNLHQINAVDGPAAFLDILAPPYDPDDGRDCHYYQVLEPASSSAESGEQQQHTWLLEIPQPADFWCGGEPYPGPRVSL